MQSLPISQSLYQRARSLVAPVFKVTALELVIQGLGFVIMAIKFRYFGATFMGLIGYFGALGELPSAFYSNFNRGLQRFLPTAAPMRRVEIFIATFFFQVVFLALFFAVLTAIALTIPKWAFWRSHMVLEGGNVGFVVNFTGAIIILILVQGVLSSLMSAMHLYLEVQILKLAQCAVQLAAFLALTWMSAGKLKGLWIYYWMMTGIIVVSSLYMASRAARWLKFKEYFAELKPGGLRLAIVSVYREQFLPYTLPKQVTSILAYVKENIAVIFLGHMGLLADAAVFNLANKMYGLPRRFLPGIVSMMLPKLVVLAETNKARFRSKYNDFSWAQFGLHIIAATALFAGIPIIRKLFHVENAPELTVVFYLFSANLVINAVGNANFNIIELSKDMRWYMLSVAVRIVVLVSINIFLIPRMGNIGATVALVISTVVVTAMQSWDTRKTELWDWRHNIWHFLIWIGVAAVWALLFLFFPGTYPLHF